MNDAIRQELAPTGTLRAGINMSNFLLVSSRGPNDEPRGVSPDMAAHIAGLLGVPLALVPFPRPGALADAVDDNVWDIGLIGAEPQRAEKIAFSAAYAEIEATYMVPPGSPIKTMAQVDQPGNRIAVTARAAYDLWLERNITQAKLFRTDTLDAAFAQFRAEGFEVLAGLRPRLLTDVATMPGARILDGNFTTVQQAIGTARRNTAGAAFIAEAVEKAKASGLVASLIAKHGVEGLSVAPPALSVPQA